MRNLIAGMTLMAAAAGPAVANPVALDLDTPTRINGIEAVCTGVGQEARANPAWGGYSLKVEIAGSGGIYLGDESIRVRHDGSDLVSLSCIGPWILLQLVPGHYEIIADIDGKTASSPAFVTAGIQGHIILRFPDMTATIYPRNYSDELAKALNVRNGRIEALSLQPKNQGTLLPNVHAGVNKKGASLDLQWKTN